MDDKYSAMKQVLKTKPTISPYWVTDTTIGDVEVVMEIVKGDLEK
jgi:hypothetical protein